MKRSSILSQWHLCGAIFLFIVLTCSIYPVYAQPEIKITANDAAVNDYFGYSVSIDGDYAIVGAYLDDHDAGDNTGSAYIFMRDGNDWTQQAKLTADDAEPHDYFGFSVSIDGSYAIVGAYASDDDGDRTGSAYIFVRDGENWTQQAKLLAEDRQTSDHFGHSVAISGDHAIVGVIYDDDDGDASGSAWIFHRNGENWSAHTKLTARDADARDKFGNSVSIEGNYAIVGAYENDEIARDAGAAYVFVLEENNWTEQAKLMADDATIVDHFGCSVSINGEYAIIGSYWDLNTAGSAYVFQRNDVDWTQQAKLIADDGAMGDYFGNSISIEDEFAIIGAPGDDDNAANSGSAYVFNRIGDYWVQRVKLTADDAGYRDSFGHSVSIYGGSAIAGAFSDDDANNGDNSGSAYIYLLDDLPDPEISVSPDALDFGEVDLNVTAEQTVTIGNEGNGNLTIFDISIEGERFNSDFADNIVIEPDQEYEFTVYFVPNETGGHEGALTIISSDPENNEVSIDLSGSGIEHELRNITHYLFFGIYNPFGPNLETQISIIGETVAEGEAYIVPPHNLIIYNLGESFQIYMNAFDSMRVVVEEGGIDEDIEIHLFLNNMIVHEDDEGVLQLDGIYSPDNDYQGQLWMFTDFQVWSEGPDSVQLNVDDHYYFQNGRMVVDIPLGDDFYEMLDSFELNYDTLNAAIWLPDEDEWNNHGIESAEITFEDVPWFHIALNHLTSVSGGEEAAFGGYTITYYLSLGILDTCDGGGYSPLQLTQLGETVTEGEEFEIPAIDLRGHLLGRKFQAYMNGLAGTILLVEEGSLEEDMEMHIILDSLMLFGPPPPPEDEELEPVDLQDAYRNDGGDMVWIQSPDEALQDELWMFLNLRAWTPGPDSVEHDDPNNEEFPLTNNYQMIINIPIDDDFLEMKDNFGLDYEEIDAALWDSVNHVWNQDNIEREMIDDGDDVMFQIRMNRLAPLAGGPDEFNSRQVVSLVEGWSMISLRVIPVNRNIENLFTDQAAAGTIDLLKDMHGRFWWIEGDFNNLRIWRVEQGYMIKMNDDDELVAQGAVVPFNEPIHLREGWSMVAYYPSVEIEAVEEAFVNIVDDLIIAKDDGGRFYWPDAPDAPFNNIPNLQPGEGYYLKTGAEVDFVWNIPEEEMLAGIERPQYKLPIHFISPQPTGRNMSLLITKAAIMGDNVELGVFTSDGLCVGASMLDNSGPWGVAVWGDDPTTDVKDGALKGEKLIIKVWDGLSDFSADVNWKTGEGMYNTDELALAALDLDAVYPIEFGLDAPYPNPFNSMVRLQFTLDKASIARLVIYDLCGREVVELTDGQFAIGRHAIIWNAENLPSGLYLARLQTPDAKKTVKMTLIR